MTLQVADALLEAADDPRVAVVLLTGNGRGFSAGTEPGQLTTIARDLAVSVLHLAFQNT